MPSAIVEQLEDIWNVYIHILLRVALSRLVTRYFIYIDDRQYWFFVLNHGKQSLC